MDDKKLIKEKEEIEEIEEEEKEPTDSEEKVTSEMSLEEKDLEEQIDERY